MKKYSFTRIKIKQPKAYFKNNKSRGLKKNVLSINKKVILILLLILYLIFIIYKKNISSQSSLSSLLPQTKSQIIEHFKSLLPKYKYHPLKKIKPEERINIFKLEDSIDFKRMKEAKKDKYIYDICIVTTAKYENLYARQYVEYYLKLGVDKFYIGDDNPENTENLFDILDDYIKKGIVDVETMRARNLTQMYFYEYSFRAVKLRCNWLMYIDMDEYLEFNDKNMTIKSYLHMPVFDKCDTVKIHWLPYDDNNLVFYDNRPLMERLNHSVNLYDFTRFHKSIVRGKDYKGNMFYDSIHQPNTSTVTEQCDALGNFERLKLGYLGEPKFKYGYFRHFTYKTAEEFSLKMIRGNNGREKYNYDKKLEDFFHLNKFAKEKLGVIEEILNRTFPKYYKE